MSSFDCFQKIPVGIACYLEKIGECWIVHKSRGLTYSCAEGDIRKQRPVAYNVWDFENPDNKLEAGYILLQLCGVSRCVCPGHRVKVREGTRLVEVADKKLEKKCRKLVEDHEAELKNNPKPSAKDDFFQIPIHTAKRIKRTGENECWKFEGYVEKARKAKKGGSVRCRIFGERLPVDVTLWEYFGYGPVETTYEKLEATCGTKGCIRPSHCRLREKKEAQDEYYNRRMQNIVDECEWVGNCLLCPHYDKVTGYAYGAFRDRTVQMFHREVYRWKNPGVDITGLEISHGCRYRNCISWLCVKAETKRVNNFNHKLRDKTIQRGDNNAQTTISDVDAWESYITRDIYTISDRAAYYGTSYAVISSIDNLESHVHVTDPDNYEKWAEEAYQKRQEKKAQLGPTTPKHYADACDRLLRDKIETDQGCYEPRDRYANARGYTAVFINYQYRSSHRVVAEYHLNGCKKLEKGEQVCHKCPVSARFPKPNNKCVNIEHLKIGDAVENGRDKTTEAQKKMALRVVELRRLYPNSKQEERFKMLLDDKTLTVRPNSVKHLSSIENGEHYAYITGVQTPEERKVENYGKNQERYDAKQIKIAKLRAGEKKKRKREDAEEETE